MYISTMQQHIELVLIAKHKCMYIDCVETVSIVTWYVMADWSYYLKSELYCITYVEHIHMEPLVLKKPQANIRPKLNFSFLSKLLLKLLNCVIWLIERLLFLQQVGLIFKILFYFSELTTNNWDGWRFHNLIRQETTLYNMLNV